MNKSTMLWGGVFTSLLAINVIFCSWAVNGASYSASENLSILIIAPLALVLVAIDFLSICGFIVIKHPQGKAKIVSYIAFVGASIIFTYHAWAIGVGLFGDGIANYIGQDRFRFIMSYQFAAAVSLVSTIVIARFLLPKSRK